MNVCKVPDMYKDMEYKYITEDSKTRVYLSVVREFNEAEYEKYYIRKKKEKVRKRILFIARALKYALPVLASTILYNMLCQNIINDAKEFGNLTKSNATIDNEYIGKFLDDLRKEFGY